MPQRIRLLVKLSPVATKALQALVAQSGQTPTAAATAILEAALSETEAPMVSAPAKAERDLMAYVINTARSWKAADSWDEHVTLRMFEMIEAEKLDLYRAATDGADARRINRAIGAAMRRELGAEPRASPNRRAHANASRRRQHLIATYTPLYRPHSTA